MTLQDVSLFAGRKHRLSIARTSLTHRYIWGCRQTPHDFQFCFYLTKLSSHVTYSNSALSIETRIYSEEVSNFLINLNKHNLVPNIFNMHFAQSVEAKGLLFSHSYRAAPWCYQGFIYSPTDALVGCLKKY